MLFVYTVDHLVAGRADCIYSASNSCGVVLGKMYYHDMMAPIQDASEATRHVRGLDRMMCTT